MDQMQDTQTFPCTCPSFAQAESHLGLSSLRQGRQPKTLGTGTDHTPSCPSPTVLSSQPSCQPCQAPSPLGILALWSGLGHLPPPQHSALNTGPASWRCVRTGVLGSVGFLQVEFLPEIWALHSAASSMLCLYGTSIDCL